ncbi:MAG TPA: TerC family protein [Chitinophagaceae bacterium]|jgi:predicted tellurium resistance membrane protein TerC|nr:TerC family protein [Chitinophagaceae bacterium]OPZ15905.1 MAG: Integral membrane protein TerC family protein [Bacteroidetes bacterium ADurb.BinA245]HMW67240.1 TerC family protein [Chitinophagaceae bacterium]HMX77849.1 TerC family protein [Chitinophagaceae bacterium]HNA19394.1 TerC family protein [Chitinophagaceae bacterium]
MEHLFTADSIISFVILVILEVVLGIDNVIFVSLSLNRLKNVKDQRRARRIWMITGIISRSILLFALSWLLQQKGKAIFTIYGKGFDLASMIMIAGGLFLIYKSVMEIHHKLEGEDPNVELKSGKGISFSKAIAQIMLIDAVFSFDSVITAGGTAKHIEIMIAAVIIAMIVMFLFSPAISSFIHKHPTLKMLALSFLVMIGLSLVIEGWDAEAAHQLHLKNYIYFGMAFSFAVQMLNLVMLGREAKRKAHVVELNQPRLDDEEKK